MRETISYKDNDFSFGIVDVKPFSGSVERLSFKDIDSARQGQWKVIPSHRKSMLNNQAVYLD